MNTEETRKMAEEIHESTRIRTIAFIRVHSCSFVDLFPCFFRVHPWLMLLAAMNNCRVVLVRPRIAANIGATARVMRNFGLSQLVLVAQEADAADPRGRLLATHSEDILDSA